MPYGPVEEVMPYLQRRAQENQSVLDGRAEHEKKMFWRELRRRTLNFRRYLKIFEFAFFQTLEFVTLFF